MSRKLLIMSVCLMLPLYAVTAFSRATPDADPNYDDLPVNIEAIHLNYDRNKNYLFAKGNVEIIHGSRILKADNIRINLTTKDTEARGNVTLMEGGDILSCESFDINLDSQIGEVRNARIFIKEQNIHVEGKEIKKTGLNTYVVKQGTITTCDGENPAWKINAAKINLTVEGYALSRSNILRVKGFPVVYLPYAVFPLSTKRQSGLLFPEIGHSNRSGYFVNNSFFWAISENTDATFWFDYASRKGLGNGLEYRFKLSEQTWGKFYGYFAEEKTNYFDARYRDKRDRNMQRGYFNIEGEHYFSEDFYVKSQGSYVTDREFYHDYKRMVNRSKGEIDKSNIRSVEKDESLIFFNKNWGFHNLLVNFNLYKNLRHRGPDTLQKLPQVIFSSLRRPVKGSALFYQFDSSYNFFWREEGQKGQRFDIFPKISLPVNYDGWLKFNPEIGLRGMANFNADHEKGLKKAGVFPSARAELSVTFIRIYQINGKWLKKLKHTVEPGLLYEYEPSNDQDDFPGFDVPERFFKRHSISYYLKNRFSGIIPDGTGAFEEREIGYFLVGQSFNISKPKGGLYLKGNPGKDFSDIFAEIRYGVFPFLYFKTKAAFDSYENSLRYYNAIISWSNSRDANLKFEYRYARDIFDGFAFRGRIRLTDSLRTFFRVQFDRNYRNKKYTNIGLDYSSQCWGSRISVQTRGSTAGSTSDTRFNFSFYLKGLGGFMQ